MYVEAFRVFAKCEPSAKTALGSPESGDGGLAGLTGHPWPERDFRPLPKHVLCTPQTHCQRLPFDRGCRCVGFARTGKKLSTQRRNANGFVVLLYVGLQNVVSPPFFPVLFVLRLLFCPFAFHTAKAPTGCVGWVRSTGHVAQERVETGTKKEGSNAVHQRLYLSGTRTSA